MSRKILSFPRFFVSCLAVVATLTLAFPASAQDGVNGLRLFKVHGTSIQVTSNGSLPGKGGDDACPFEEGKKDVYAAAFNGGDTDGCPYVEVGTQKRPLSSCVGFYKSLSGYSAETDNANPNPIIPCCHLEAKYRESCRGVVQRIPMRTNALMVGTYLDAKQIPTSPGIISPEQFKKSMKAYQDQHKSAQQCYNESKMRIKEYWGKMRAVSCVNTVSAMIKAIQKTGTDSIKEKMKQRVTTALASIQPIGSSPGAFLGIPSIPGLLQSALSYVDAASQLLSLVNEVSDVMNTLSNDCGNVMGKLKEMQEFTDKVSSTGCPASWAFIERSLTQCVRINVGGRLNLNLPKFSVMLQCPVNVDINLAIDPHISKGFKCFSTGATASGSLSTPQYGNAGSRSLLSGNGGLDNLFKTDCYDEPAPDTVNAGPRVTTRTAGVDCGPLDSDPGKQVAILGQKALPQGAPVADGWAVGGSETINNMMITRCDFFQNSNKVRTAYVYGSGASCNTGTSGFLNGGNETNTACYPGGYTPAVGLNVPDACMYPVSCIGADGKFNAALSGCAGKLPQDPKANGWAYAMNTYVPDTAGINGQAPAARLCGDDFAKAQDLVLCCDPAKQDCSKRDASVPLCQCDSGDANNAVINSTTGQCAQGGIRTCCSPRLNGEGGCDTQEMKQKGVEICADEINQCSKMDAPAVWTGPTGAVTSSDGKGNKLTAAQLASSKPSPYLYLFIRPDGNMDGQQCCTTEWCNVCPQHYVNAYGLSLMRSESLPSASAGDSWNNSLTLKGWPFQQVESESSSGMTDTSYVIGREVQLSWSETKWNPFLGFKRKKQYDVRGNRMALYLSENMKMPMSLTACEQATGLHAIKVASDYFPDQKNAMGFVGGEMDDDDKSKAIVVGGVPAPAEYPIDFMNRQRASITDSQGTPLMPIPLCGDVKLCLPKEAGTVIPSQPQKLNLNGFTGAGVNATGMSATTVTGATTTNSATNNTTSTNGSLVGTGASMGSATAPAVSTPVQGVGVGASAGAIVGGSSAGGASTGGPAPAPGGGTGPTAVPGVQPMQTNSAVSSGLY